MMSLLAAQKLTDLDPLVGYDDRDYEYEEPTEETSEEHVFDSYPAEDDVGFERTNNPFDEYVYLPNGEWYDEQEAFGTVHVLDRSTRACRRTSKRRDNDSRGVTCRHGSKKLREQIALEAEAELQHELTIRKLEPIEARRLLGTIRRIKLNELDLPRSWRNRQLSWKAMSKSPTQYGKNPDQIGRRAAKRRAREQKLEQRQQQAKLRNEIFSDERSREHLALIMRDHAMNEEEAITFYDY